MSVLVIILSITFAISSVCQITSDNGMGRTAPAETIHSIDEPRGNETSENKSGDTTVNNTPFLTTRLLNYIVEFDHPFYNGEEELEINMSEISPTRFNRDKRDAGVVKPEEKATEIKPGLKEIILEGLFDLVSSGLTEGIDISQIGQLLNANMTQINGIKEMVLNIVPMKYWKDNMSEEKNPTDAEQKNFQGEIPSTDPDLSAMFLNLGKKIYKTVVSPIEQYSDSEGVGAASAPPQRITRHVSESKGKPREDSDAPMASDHNSTSIDMYNRSQYTIYFPFYHVDFDNFNDSNIFDVYTSWRIDPQQ